LKPTKNDQRYFLDLDFEYLDGFSNKDFSDIVFKSYFLYVDFGNSNLTNAKFIGHEEFEENIIHSDAYILTKKLSEKEYKETMGSKMTDVTQTAEPVVDIWAYVKDLVYENIVNDYVFKNNLVEKVYRNDTSSFDHILLPTSDEHIFIVLVVKLGNATIVGHYRLDLTKEYSLD